MGLCVRPNRERHTALLVSSLACIEQGERHCSPVCDIPVCGVVRQVKRQDSVVEEQVLPRLDPRAESLVDLLIYPFAAELLGFGYRRTVRGAERRVGSAVGLVAVFPGQSLAFFRL